MVHPALFVEGGDRFGARDLAVRGMHRGERHIRIGHAQHRLDHLAAIVHFRDDAVGMMRAAGDDRGLGPFRRRVTVGGVGQHIAVPGGVAAGDDYSRFVRSLARRRGRIDRDDDPYQVGVRCDAGGVDQPVGP